MVTTIVVSIIGIVAIITVATVFALSQEDLVRPEIGINSMLLFAIFLLLFSHPDKTCLLIKLTHYLIFKRQDYKSFSYLLLLRVFTCVHGMLLMITN